MARLPGRDGGLADWQLEGSTSRRPTPPCAARPDERLITACWDDVLDLATFVRTLQGLSNGVFGRRGVGA